MRRTNGTNLHPDPTRRRAAWVAGLGLLAMAVLAPFAHFFVFQPLIVPGDAGTTTANLAASAPLARVGLAALLVVAMLDVAVAWALHIVFEPVDRALSLLAAWLRLAYAAAFAVALSPLVHAVQAASGTGQFGPLEPGQLHVQVGTAIASFRNGWDLALAIFALHLLCLGIVVVRSGFLPRFLGGLVILAGVGYAVDSFGVLLAPGHGIALSEVTFVGEALLMLWLLARGMNPSAWADAPSSTDASHLGARAHRWRYRPTPVPRRETDEAARVAVAPAARSEER